MIRKPLVATFAAAAILLTASPASARPVIDSPDYCGPGLSQSVYDVNTGDLREGVCLTQQRPAIVAPRASVWWNPWTWF